MYSCVRSVFPKFTDLDNNVNIHVGLVQMIKVLDNTLVMLCQDWLMRDLMLTDGQSTVKFQYYKTSGEEENFIDSLSPVFTVNNEKIVDKTMTCFIRLIRQKHDV